MRRSQPCACAMRGALPLSVGALAPFVPPSGCLVVKFCWSESDVDAPWPAVTDTGVTPGMNPPGCSSGKGLSGLRVCNGRTKSFPRPRSRGIHPPPVTGQLAILIAGKMAEYLTARQPSAGTWSQRAQWRKVHQHPAKPFGVPGERRCVCCGARPISRRSPHAGQATPFTGNPIPPRRNLP